MPRAIATWRAARSSAQARPLSGDAAWRSTSASSSGEIVTPGTRPVLKTRADARERTNTFASRLIGSPSWRTHCSSSWSLRAL